MTNQNFQVGDRVFDDVFLEFGIVTFSKKYSVMVEFPVHSDGLYFPDGRMHGENRPRLHKQNPAQEIFEKINEAFNKGEKE